MLSVESAFVQFLHTLVGTSGVIDWFAIFFAEYIPYLAGGLGLFLMLRWGTLKERAERLVFAALVLVLGRGFISEMFYFFATRPRPFTAFGFTPLFSEAGSAFPSRHAVLLFSLAAIMFTVKRSYGWWFTVLAVVVGAARVYAGVHYPTDILGGAAIAAVAFFAVRALVNYHYRKHRSSVSSEAESINEETIEKELQEEKQIEDLEKGEEIIEDIKEVAEEIEEAS